MKKTLIFFLFTFLFLQLSLPVKAQEQGTYIGEGYTTEGIHYTIYEIETAETSSRAIGDKLDVVRQFIFEGIVIPPKNQQHVERIGTITYVGTITLYAFSFEDGNTIATYEGTLNAVN